MFIRTYNPKPIPGEPFTHKINRRVTMEFVWIPAGSFLMGDPQEGQVQVTLSRGFWMGKFPVTQEQYEAVTGERKLHLTRDSGRRHPVYPVSWQAAAHFCHELCEPLGRRNLNKSLKFRLPSEAEWEYACRAGGTQRFCFGDDESKLKEYAWYARPMMETLPVGQMKANAWGLHDMHGNVWEWCQDWYGSYPKHPVVDPRWPIAGDARVLRGGAYNVVGPEFMSCAYRHKADPDKPFGISGFRCALSIVDRKGRPVKLD